MCLYHGQGVDANDYYRYFLKRNERFLIRTKKNWNIIYNGKICNSLDVSAKYKGNYRMDFKENSGKKTACKNEPYSCKTVRIFHQRADARGCIRVFGKIDVAVK